MLLLAVVVLVMVRAFRRRRRRCRCCCGVSGRLAAVLVPPSTMGWYLLPLALRLRLT